MISNLLNSLTDPDNIPDGYSTIDIRFTLTIVITLIAVTVTLIAAYIIYYLYKNCNNETIKNKTWIKPTIIITAIGITILLITLGCIICSKY